MRSSTSAPTASRRAGGRSSLSSTPGRKRARTASRPMKPAARGLTRQTSCFSPIRAAGAALPIPMAIAELKIFPDKDALARGAADFVEARVADNPGRVGLCLTGGSTPEGMYKLLAKRALPWERIHVFWGDERFVPIGDPLSNARMTSR